MKDEEIIFQIKIDRKTFSFELVKQKLNGFEQNAFEHYLRKYVLANDELGKQQIIEEYLEDE